jgi:O-antigen/teichoic acid export membrane protein
MNKSTSGFKKYLANTSWVLVERVLRMGMAFFVGVYVARYLGPERFGLLSYANSFVGLFAGLTALGLNSIVTRELVKTPEYRDELLGSAFWLKIAGAGLMWIGIVCAIPFTQNNTYENTLIAIIAFSAIFQAFNVIDFHYQAQVKSKYVVYAKSAQLVVSSITKITLVVIEAPLIWFAWVYLLDAVVLAIGLITVYLHNTGKIWSWQWGWQVASALLRDSWPLILSGMAVSLQMKIDQVMIKEMLSAKEVGLYAAAVKLSEAWYFIPMAITFSVFPAIVNAKKQNKALYYQRLQKLYDFMIWLAVLIALPTTFLAPWIIELLYGKEYLQASNVLSIHIWAGVFVSLGIASSRWFVAENYVKKSLYRGLFGLVVNVVLNVLLIPIYGILGAAIATLISQMSFALLYDFFDRQTYVSLRLKIKAFFPFHYFKKL